MKNFGVWLKNYSGDGPIGDLRDDFLRDIKDLEWKPSDFHTPDLLAIRMQRQGACPEAMEALTEAALLFKASGRLTKQPSRVARKDFGTWKLSGSNLILKSQNWRVIDLECDSSAEILDWIFHYRGRLDTQEKADLLDAIEEILHPRKNYCSSGQDLRPSGAALVKEYRQQGGRGE